MGVKNAFLHGLLDKHVYMEQPLGFIDPKRLTDVCCLRRALYGLRQALLAWFDRFSSFLLAAGFFYSLFDSSLFICRSSHGTIILLLYVDDIILTGDNPALLQIFIARLHNDFAMKDLGGIHYFLGVQVTRFPGGLFLNQSKYAYDLLDRA